MFTQCPDCRTVYPLGTGLNQEDRTRQYCNVCEKEFNAVEYLTENPLGLLHEAKAETIVQTEVRNQPKSKKKRKRRYSPSEDPAKEPVAPPPLPLVEETVIPLQPEVPPAPVIDIAEPVESGRLPWEAEEQNDGFNWQLGVISGLVLLVAQLLIYSADDVSQSVFYRPYAEKFARLFHATIDDYQNLNEFELTQGAFSVNPDKTISFKAVLTNQAPFRQKLPDLKLSLLDYEGRLFAQRTFSPPEYLSGQAGFSHIDPDESKEVQLMTGPTQTPVGGYNFDLVYRN